MSSTLDRPTFRALERDEIYQVLSRNHVGRMAFARGTRMDVEPVHYVYEGGWIYGRTSRGAKLEATEQEWWPVAFEVDEIHGLFRWRSVVVHGGFYTMSPDHGAWEREQWDAAVRVLRRLIPETFTDADPTPFRNVVFRIAVQEVSGRAAEPGTHAAPAAAELDLPPSLPIGAP
ncbi:MAG TPA: pyridoxamine 5'-phosphate oxidase family protein [Longimicrobiaceae bacterium]|nr:pyridoxamine 5'-phosphate oxidase family protein [Longimicrobiaceae bacterium]